ncbi:hypothetical protein [Plantactinospora sp. BC1]|uniref:hypothetical protein n=1 Tax=Plantactinospora sp. BC1 TaxID=2108470 RepID=UPI00131F487C|nr:hypothetical protein [Plantactinospora sp. BC1]
MADALFEDGTDLPQRLRQIAERPAGAPVNEYRPAPFLLPPEHDDDDQDVVDENT